jgi:hypothetical protein
MAAAATAGPVMPATIAEGRREPVMAFSSNGGEGKAAEEEEKARDLLVAVWERRGVAACVAMTCQLFGYSTAANEGGITMAVYSY